MIVSRHIGRLGNNMFQIAAAIAYAKEYGYEWAADQSNGTGEPYSAIHKVFPNLPKVQFGGGIRYQEHPNKHCEKHGVHMDLCHFDYHKIPNLGPNISLTGFFQSYKYFENAQDEVKKVFALPHVEGYEDYVSIHVRRGDYVQYAGSFPPIDMAYLAESISKFWIDYRKSKFLVFSDDIHWCRTKLISDSIITFEFSEGRTEAEDLALMASCGHHIIANSTFSWWAAYLGHNHNRIVISPSAETWFGPTSGVKRPVVDLLHDSWIKINTR